MKMHSGILLGDEKERNPDVIHETAKMSLNNIVVGERGQAQETIDSVMLSLQKVQKEPVHTGTEIRREVLYDWGREREGKGSDCQHLRCFSGGGVGNTPLLHNWFHKSVGTRKTNKFCK